MAKCRSFILIKVGEIMLESDLLRLKEMVEDQETGLAATHNLAQEAPQEALNIIKENGVELPHNKVLTATEDKLLINGKDLLVKGEKGDKGDPGADGKDHAPVTQVKKVYFPSGFQKDYHRSGVYIDLCNLQYSHEAGKAMILKVSMLPFSFIRVFSVGNEDKTQIRIKALLSEPDEITGKIEFIYNWPEYSISSAEERLYIEDIFSPSKSCTVSLSMCFPRHTGFEAHESNYITCSVSGGPVNCSRVDMR